MATPDEIKELRLDAEAAVLQRIITNANKATPQQLLTMTEAYAWLAAPAQAHSGDLS